MFQLSNGDDVAPVPPGWGDTGNGKEPDNLRGQQVLGPDGEIRILDYLVPSGAGGLFLLDPTGQRGPLGFKSGGPVVSVTGILYQVNNKGEIQPGSRTLTADERNSLGIGFGETSGGAGAAQGVSAPDPIGAANVLLRQYETMVSNSNGTFTAEQAWAEFQKDWQDIVSTQDRAQAELESTATTQNLQKVIQENEDRRLREQAEADRRVQVAQEAGTRGRAVLQQLPSTLPVPQGMSGGQINLPLGVSLPMNTFRFSDIFNQGGVGNLANLPAISPEPAVPYGPPITAPQLPPLGAMPQFPAPPQYPAMPDLSALINAGARGFSGF